MLVNVTVEPKTVDAWDLFSAATDCCSIMLSLLARCSVCCQVVLLRLLGRPSGCGFLCRAWRVEISNLKTRSWMGARGRC